MGWVGGGLSPFGDMETISSILMEWYHGQTIPLSLWEFGNQSG